MSAGINPKLRQIVATGRTLFWKHGIRRITITEICREAKVSKMTFYKHFRNKNALVKHIIAQITDERWAQYDGIKNRDIPFQEKVRLGLEMKLQQTDELSQEFFTDIHKNADAEIRDFFHHKMQTGIQKVLAHYVEAQKQGQLRADIKPEFLLYFMNLSMQMLRDENLTKLYEAPQALIMEITKFFFYGILPRQTDDTTA